MRLSPSSRTCLDGRPPLHFSEEQLMSYMDRRMRNELDNYITGHYGEDQLKITLDEHAWNKYKEHPSPAAVAWATRLSEEDFLNVYQLAAKIDEVAEEARMNERKRIFSMGFIELLTEVFRVKKIHKLP